jgi:ABC-2 type transport system ATP-binding protein
VAILANGRLVSEGRLSEILAFRIRGWELVVSGLSDAALEQARASAGVLAATRLGPERYALELPLTVPPERLLAELVATGAALVSLNPLRDTLEDFFVREVATAPAGRGLEGAEG